MNNETKKTKIDKKKLIAKKNKQIQNNEIVKK